MNVTGPRDDLIEALGSIDGLSAYADWSDVVNPPGVVVLPGSPWLDKGLAFRESILSASVLLLSGPLERPDALTFLESLLVEVLAVGDQAGWGLAGVQEPTAIPVNGTKYLGTEITFTRPVRA